MNEKLGEILRSLCFTRMYQALFEVRWNDRTVGVNPWQYPKYLYWGEVHAEEKN